MSLELSWKEMYRQKLMPPEEAVKKIPDGALISIAHPDFRDWLKSEAQRLKYI